MHARRLIGHVEMPQDRVDDLRIHQHADQLERSTAARIEERVSLVDAAQQPCPADRHARDGVREQGTNEYPAPPTRGP